MGLGNILVLSEVTLFLLTLILSFLILVPLGINQREFDGHCLLYASGVWRTNVTGGTAELTDVDWGPHSACGFNIFMGVVILFTSIFYTVKDSLHLFRNTDSSWLSAFVTAILSFIILLMLLASSLTLSVGFNKWCDLLTQPETLISDCATADFINFADELKDVYTKNFYTEFKMAEFGLWTCFVCWIFLTVFSLVKVYKYQQHENFMTSLDRERQRLLQKVGHQRDAAV